jgi:cysteine synthase A
MEISTVVGNTPLIKIDNIYAKLETTNPTGSIKDRMAWYMTIRAEDQGLLKKGSTIIECTSGNTGIAFSMIAAARGYRFIAVLPECMSIERQKMMKSFGAKVVLSPAAEFMNGAVRCYNEVCREYPDAWRPSQFENEDNFQAHRLGTGREIIAQMKGKVDCFVAGVGTGGTLIGVALALKEAKIPARIVFLEPDESAVLSGGPEGIHEIQGIGEGFIPGIVQRNRDLFHEIIRIRSIDAIAMSRKLARQYGLLVGISAGANVLAAQLLADKYGYKSVVTVMADRGERYLTDLQT